MNEEEQRTTESWLKERENKEIEKMRIFKIYLFFKRSFSYINRAV